MVASHMPPTGTWTITQACALTGTELATIQFARRHPTNGATPSRAPGIFPDPPVWALSSGPLTVWFLVVQWEHQPDDGPIVFLLSR